MRDRDLSLTNFGNFPLGLSTITTYIETAGSTGYINGSFVKTSNILYAVHFKG